MAGDEPHSQDLFKSVCAAFFNYQVDSIREIDRNSEAVQAVQVEKLKQIFRVRIEQLRTAVYANYVFPWKSLPNGSYVIPNLHVNQKDVSQVHSVLKRCAREWSQEGVETRAASHGLLVQEVQCHFPAPTQSSPERKVSILIPEAGLGRLPFEFARLGYTCQGHCPSYYHLLPSDLVINHTKQTLPRFTSLTSVLPRNRISPKTFP